MSIRGEQERALPVLDEKRPREAGLAPRPEDTTNWQHGCYVDARRPAPCKPDAPARDAGGRLA